MRPIFDPLHLGRLVAPELPPLAKAYLLYQKSFAAEAAAVCRDALRFNPAYVDIAVAASNDIAGLSGIAVYSP
jgi:hypothetical protein